MNYLIDFYFKKQSIPLHVFFQIKTLKIFDLLSLIETIYFRKKQQQNTNQTNKSLAKKFTFVLNPNTLLYEKKYFSSPYQPFFIFRFFKLQSK